MEVLVALLIVAYLCIAGLAIKYTLLREKHQELERDFAQILGSLYVNGGYKYEIPGIIERRLPDEKKLPANINAIIHKGEQLPQGGPRLAQ